MLVVVVEIVKQEVIRSRKRRPMGETLFVKEVQVVSGGRQEVCQMLVIGRWWQIQSHKWYSRRRSA